jgi:hypothetical protein
MDLKDNFQARQTPQTAIVQEVLNWPAAVLPYNQQLADGGELQKTAHCHAPSMLVLLRHSLGLTFSSLAQFGVKPNQPELGTISSARAVGK